MCYHGACERIEIMGHSLPVRAVQEPAAEAEEDAEVRRSMAALEQGLASAAVEGHHLNAADEAYARSLIERGLSVEERRDAMDTYFDANPLPKRGQVASDR